MTIIPIKTITNALKNKDGEGEFIELLTLQQLRIKSFPTGNSSGKFTRTDENITYSPSFERSEKKFVEIEHKNILYLK